MRVNGPFETACRGSVKNLPVAARAIEKASPASLLQQQAQNEDSRRPTEPPRLQVELVCQDETAGFDPKWDGPRLLPTFVAQLMGQAMPERRNPAPLETPYGIARDARMALLVDRRS